MGKSKIEMAFELYKVLVNVYSKDAIDASEIAEIAFTMVDRFQLVALERGYWADPKEVTRTSCL